MRYFEKEHQLEEWLIRERLEKIEIARPRRRVR